MRRFAIAILSAAAQIIVMSASISPSAWAQDVSHLNQDMDNRPNLQAEQAVGGHTSRPGVNVQDRVSTSTPTPPSNLRRRTVKTTKTPPQKSRSATAAEDAEKLARGPAAGGAAPP
jgi:hypothetical protein